jgi:hypothetical protein
MSYTSIPAQARQRRVIPAQAGIHASHLKVWIPAFAGMTQGHRFVRAIFPTLYF